MFYIGNYVDSAGVLHWNTKIVPFDTDHLEEDSQGNWWPVPTVTVGQCRAVAYRHFTIPCGKCIGCRLDYSRTWANRLMLEYKYYSPDECWFVTLTYDNENVPINYYCDSETGERRPSLSLRKRDFQLFNKSLRDNFGYRKIRYYLCGEYGEKTHRPHGHAIYFGLPLDPFKLVKWKVSDQGFTLYKCPELEKIWSRGNVFVSSVSWETCAYVSRYVTKKLNGDAAKFYELFNLEPEFSLMSRKPGIGRRYFDEHPDCIEKGIHLATDTRGFNFSAPRYFKSIWKLDNVIDSEYNAYNGSLRQDDLVASQKAINDLARQDYLVYLDNLEKEKRQISSSLRRSDI